MIPLEAIQSILKTWKDRQHVDSVPPYGIGQILNVMTVSQKNQTTTEQGLPHSGRRHQNSDGQTAIRKIRHVFILGAKCIGQYGGYETFVDCLTAVHSSETGVKYHILTKANGDGAMDESKLVPLPAVRRADGIEQFEYHNAHVVKIPVPRIGEAQAVAYDVKAFRWCLRYISSHHIADAVIYVLACRIGPFFRGLVRKAHILGAVVYVNPDGHEWKRAKWSVPIRKYWKESERLMVKYADLLVCDSTIIEKYIRMEYERYRPKTVNIAYGADVKTSVLDDDDPKFMEWMKIHQLRADEYYMCCGRLVPENSFETMIREYMASHSKRDFVIIATENEKFTSALDARLGWRRDKRIKFTGTVYDRELLKKIRECAYGNIHGHTVGGTNPSLLEALGSTKLNLLIDVGFNREVAKDSALYWKPESGNLSRLIDQADAMEAEERERLGRKAKERIQTAYSWELIGDEYKKLWLNI